MSITVNIATSDNFIEQLSAWGPVIIGIVSILLSIVSYNLAKKNAEQQSIQFNTQLKNEQTQFAQKLNLQTRQWKFDNLFKYKLQKMLELKKLFKQFKINTIEFLGLFMPSNIGYPFEQGSKLAEITKLDIDKDLKYEFQKTIFNQAPNEMLKLYKENCKILTDFLLENDVFLMDNSEFYEDLKALSATFKELYDKLSLNDDLNKLFLFQKNKYILIFPNHSFCRFFYKFIQCQLHLKRGEMRNHIFYLYSNSIFKTNQLSYSDSEIDKWCSNPKVLFNTYLIFNNLLQDLENQINNFFIPSLNEMKEFSETLFKEESINLDYTQNER